MSIVNLNRSWTNYLATVFSFLLASSAALGLGNYVDLMRVGKEYQTQKQYRAAAEQFQQAAQLKPGSYEAQLELGKTLAKLGDDDRAMLAFFDALKADGKQVEPRAQLAAMMMKRSNWDEAGGQLKQILDVMPEDTTVRGNYALCLEGLGYVDAAIEQYRIIIQKNPKSLEAYYNLAVALQVKSNWDEAAINYRKCISMAPKNSLAFTGLGRCLMAKQDYTAALIAEKRAIELYPNNHWAYLTMGQIYESTGRTADSNEAFRKAIQINPKDPACRNALAGLLKQKMANISNSSLMLTR